MVTVTQCLNMLCVLVFRFFLVANVQARELLFSGYSVFDVIVCEQIQARRGDRSYVKKTVVYNMSSFLHR